MKYAKILPEEDNLIIKKRNHRDKVIALVGNPNVGKSTVFNGLTGMHQHTGNWPGKTVSNAKGRFHTDKNPYVLVDLPGTYSLFAHSAEEEVARNFICFENPDACIVLCDATCLERNLNLVFQTFEITDKIIVCVNLMDEAKRKHIDIDLDKLRRLLGVPVVGISARNKKNLNKLTKTLDKFILNGSKSSPFATRYPEKVETAISMVEYEVKKLTLGKINSRWLALRLFDADSSLFSELKNFLGFDIAEKPEVKNALLNAKNFLSENNINAEDLKDILVSTLVENAFKISKEVCSEKTQLDGTDRKIDRFLTSRLTGYPVMIFLLFLIFWLTITGANYPSAILSKGFSYLETVLFDFLSAINIPLKINEALSFGVLRVLGWVISVMLPPMAIFFPLFTFLEDTGYLPRIAYNLDKPFKRCSACGKQALTMCMGFGCNAAGVTACRIIDSPRERLIAVLTNNFVPCNGRFPAMISIITIFFIGTKSGLFSSLSAALILTAVIILGIGATFIVSAILSKTVLKGVPSSFTLELPPYRPPQVLKIIVRSVFDRTLFVLMRAISVAAPSGLIIWLFANINTGNASLLSVFVNFFEPFARLLGLDGELFMAFILGFPANEIVLPIALMAYTDGAVLTELGSLSEIQNILIANGWTHLTACSVILFSLFHWPCSTTMLTIKKETGSIKWTLLAFLIPTFVGMFLCFLITSFAHIFVC